MIRSMSPMDKMMPMAMLAMTMMMFRTMRMHASSQ